MYNHLLKKNIKKYLNNFDQNDNRPKLLFILYIQACLYFFSKVQSLYLFLTFTRII